MHVCHRETFGFVVELNPKDNGFKEENLLGKIVIFGKVCAVSGVSAVVWVKRKDTKPARKPYGNSHVEDSDRQ